MKVKNNWTNVTIVATDMRDFNPEEKADILVSELLGSFGDNELSPECLDGAQKYLKESGISIPANYTSFLSPISTSKLWGDVSATSKGPKDFEVGYVVKFHDFHVLGLSKPCFFFEHPNRDEPIDNSRYVTLQWHVDHSALLHGFAGYFESVLYKEVMISINPDTFSKGMFSWFPIYFPLDTPVYVPANSMVEVRFWRCISSKKVWYEWCLSSPQPSAIHNANGEHYWIGL